MAFVVQCPFCKLQARVPDRANGAIGRCPKCASSFTLVSADDQHLPESPVAPAAGADEANSDPIDASAIGIAIAEAAAAVEEATPVDPHRPAPAGFQPVAAAGALALLLSGIALICSSISFLRGFVLPLSAVGLLTGFTAVVVARLSARPRLLLPIAGGTAAGTMLMVAWLFPALLGPAFEHARKSPAPVPVGLRAIPLAGAPALAEPTEWIDAKRYALQRDGLRVQVVRVSLLPPAAIDPKAPRECLLVRVRVSLDSADAKPLERKENPSPTLTDEMSKPCVLRQSEFFDRGGGKSKPGLYPVPTIEETFVFETPVAGWKTMRLELPAARWKGTGEFQFTIATPAASGPAPEQKNK